MVQIDVGGLKVEVPEKIFAEHAESVHMIVLFSTALAGVQETLSAGKVQQEIINKVILMIAEGIFKPDAEAEVQDSNSD